MEGKREEEQDGRRGGDVGRGVRWGGEQRGDEERRKTKNRRTGVSRLPLSEGGEIGRARAELNPDALASTYILAELYKGCLKREGEGRGRW